MKGYIMPHIDIKKSTWDRITVTEAEYSEILAKFRSGEYTDSNDICCNHEFEIESIDDTDEELTPEDNNGAATIEVYSENGADSDWKNGE